jgi:hypothetical protein
MVVRWDGDATEVLMDSWGRVQAFEGLMKHSRLEYPPFDDLAKSLAESDSYSTRRAGQDRAALCYSFRLVDTIRFLSVLRHGLGITEHYPNGETRDIIWRPDEVRRALEHEFRRPMPVLVTSGLS